jgi:hypothetical protein
MFVRLLVLLISNVLYSFSVFIVLQILTFDLRSKAWKWPRCISSPWKCDRSHLVRSNALRAIERMPMIDCTPHQPYSPRYPSRPYAPSLQHLRRGQLRAIDRTMCDRTQRQRLNTHYMAMHRKSNASQMIERMQGCDRSHHLRSNAPLTWQHVLFCL